MRYIKTEIINRKGYITLNRPEKRNALSPELVEDLKTALHEMEKNTAVKVVVIRAEGKAFCAGADLAYIQSMQNFSYDENLEDSNNLKALFEQIYTHPKVIIAQIEGHAIAGGCGLASVCDFSFTVPEAKFGYTEVKIGFVPALVMVFLIRKIGEVHARSLLLRGDLVSSETAIDMGMINYQETAKNIAKAVEEFADHLIENNSEESLALTKKMIAKVQSVSLEEGLDFASKMNAKARATEDCKKGINSFLTKEKLTW